MLLLVRSINARADRSLQTGWMFRWALPEWLAADQSTCPCCHLRPLHHMMQCVELDFHYPSEGIHKRWDSGFRITCTASTHDQSAFILSQVRRKARLYMCVTAVQLNWVHCRLGRLTG